MLDNFNSNQKKIIIIISIVISIGIIYFIYNKHTHNNFIVSEENMLIENNVEEKMEEDEEEIIIVHITGAVKIPGIVKLKEGSRIEDAINSAGGLTEDADISNVNLAYILEDGIKIKIPRSTDIEGTSEEEIITEGKGEALENDVSSVKSKTDSTININKADETQLEQLPGIGASLATKIVEYRNQNGKFSSIEEIKNVNGIGENKYKNIKEYIKVK